MRFIKFQNKKFDIYFPWNRLSTENSYQAYVTNNSRIIINKILNSFNILLDKKWQP